MIASASIQPDTSSNRTIALTRQPIGLAAGPTTDRLSRLRALVLLSGVVRAKSWINDIDRSVLDLPVDAGKSVLAHWFEHAAQLAAVATCLRGRRMFQPRRWGQVPFCQAARDRCSPRGRAWRG